MRSVRCYVKSFTNQFELDFLVYRVRVPHICVGKPSQHWFRWIMGQCTSTLSASSQLTKTRRGGLISGSRLSWTNARLCLYYWDGCRIGWNLFLLILLAQSMMYAMGRIHDGLKVVFCFGSATPPHYHHDAGLLIGVEHRKCLSGIYCRECLWAGVSSPGYPFSDIWTSICSIGPFEFKWLKGYTVNLIGNNIVDHYAMLPLHLHPRRNIWLQWIGQRQLQDEKHVSLGIWRAFYGIFKPSYYHHQIGSINLSHNYHSFRGCMSEVVMPWYPVLCYIHITGTLGRCFHINVQSRVCKWTSKLCPVGRVRLFANYTI